MKLNSYIHSVIPFINGDFKQKEILKKWDEILLKIPTKTKLTLAVCEANVSSGTYIRAMVKKIGDELHIPTLAYSIERTKIDILF
jgi:tRNA U55 pseudouridine synthase TruB